MTTPIPSIGGIAPLPGITGAATTPGAAGITGAGNSVAGTAATRVSSSGPDFATALANGLDQVAAAQATADQLAVQAATGQLVDPAQYTIAATKATLMTQLATTVESKAVAAFNTIMAMQA